MTGYINVNIICLTASKYEKKKHLLWSCQNWGFALGAGNYDTCAYNNTKAHTYMYVYV